MEKSCCNENIKEIQKNCHSRMFLSGIPTALETQGGDPRLQASGMTAKGFTLIELLVVVLIIGILAAIALPQYQKAVTKAHMAKMRTMLEEVVRAGKLYYLRTGEYPTSFDDLDINLSLEHVGTPSCGANLNHKKDALGGDGFEISLADNSQTKYNYVSAYFTTGKYKCRGWSYYWKYPPKPALENRTFCAEHYYGRACGSGCEPGILCNKIHGGWKYYDNSGLVFLF